jgi:hypothetical protein
MNEVRQSEKRHLFLGGNARSGTTALMELLNAHPKIFLLSERYLTEIKRSKLTPAHFVKENVLAGPVPKAMTRYGDDLDARWEAAEYVGDKCPALHAGFDNLDAQFPEAKLIYIVRNPIGVCASYATRQERGNWNRGVEDAMRDWNKSVKRGLKRVSEGKPLIVIPYEEMFKDRTRIDKLWRELGLDPAEADPDRMDRVLLKAQTIGDKVMQRDDDMFSYISRTAATGVYRKLIEEYSLFRTGEAATSPAP